jgi:hypothetical protein
VEPLSPYALGTLDELLRHLRADGPGDQESRDRAVIAGNSAVGYMERRTGRALRVRTHRNTVNFVGTWTATAATVSSIADTSILKAHDDIVGAGLQPGTRIVSIDSAVAITLDKIPTAAGTGATLTAGSRPLLVDGEGTASLWIPEKPVGAVYSVKWRDTAGTLTALSLTGASLERETGRYLLPSDTVPKGEHNVEVECLAGYTPPSDTERGDLTDWSFLRRLWLRIAEIYAQEAKTLAGRRTSTRTGPADWQAEAEMPRDVERDLGLYLRRP